MKVIKLFLLCGINLFILISLSFMCFSSDFIFPNEYIRPITESINCDQPCEKAYIVNSNGTLLKYPAWYVISNMLQTEMGDSFPSEALKAQAILIHTKLLKDYQRGIYPSLTLKYPSDNIINCVNQVLNFVLVSEDGQLAFVAYCSSVAERTNPSEEIWGTKHTVSVESKYDYLAPGYKTICRYKYEDIIRLFNEKWNINLTDIAPPSMFKILNFTSGGYNGAMSVGPYTQYYRKFTKKNVAITGRLIREEVLTNLKSSKFEFEYDKNTDEFIFTTYGHGHGVGFSQWGSKFYHLIERWGHPQLLMHYLPNCKIVRIR